MINLKRVRKKYFIKIDLFEKTVNPNTSKLLYM